VYLRNLFISLGHNTFLAREDGKHSIEFYIRSAIDELSDMQAIGLSEIKYFIVPVDLEDIKEYVKPFQKEIELMNQI